MTTEVVTIEQLTAKMRIAADAADVTTMLSIAAEIKKMKAEVAAAEAKRLAAEAEALSGVRTEAVEKLDKMIRKTNGQMQALIKLAESVKAVGFHYRHVFADNVTEIGFDYLSAPKATVRKSNGTSSGGKSKTEYGLSLNEIFEKYATADDRAALTVASAKATRPDSAEYTVKLAVKKRVIADGTLKPIS